MRDCRQLQMRTFKRDFLIISLLVRFLLTVEPLGVELVQVLDDNTAPVGVVAHTAQL